MGDSGLNTLLWVAAFSTCLKLLMVPSYHSTDFEVHRHWLAITHTLPLKEWYLDETSEWTLDYPPFFAWFERFLALFASRVEPRMVDLTNGLYYASDRAILFHRATVIIADGVLYWGLWKFCRNFTIQKQGLLYAAVIFSPGLFIVDHIHFQYNGFLLGMLLLSLSALRDGKDLMGGLWFAVLVCFKHLFAIAGPIYFVYLLRHYCRGPTWFARFWILGLSVSSVVGVAFGPFVYYEQTGQILKRLFPFGRGLCHAYWAPNVWAMYNAADKILALILGKLGFAIHTPEAAMTGGLVGESAMHTTLPQITPTVTAVLVMAALAPCLIQIWRHPSQSEIVRWVAYAYMCGFLFGWHVHEKASLQFVIPFTLLAVESVETSVNFLFMSTVSYYSLFPLLFEMREYPVKVLLVTIYSAGMLKYTEYYFQILSNKNTGAHTEMHTKHLEGKKLGVGQGNQLLDAFGTHRKLYLLGLIPLEIYGQFLHHLLFKDWLPFVPLMLVSVYCAVGMVYLWALQLYETIVQPADHKFD